MNEDFRSNLNTIEQKACLENLVEVKYEKLYACAFRMTGNHHDAQDVLQNAFLKAYKNIGSFRQESTLYTWLYRILINESYRYFDYIEKLPITIITERLGVSEKDFFESIQYIPDYNDNLIIDEMREKCLQAFLKCMPKNQRVCFLLKTCLKLKNKEIAEILEVSVENVKVLLHRGRKKLQELLEMRCNLIDPEKPCKCHLWIKYMKEHNLPIPSGYNQMKNEELKKEYFSKMSLLKKVDYLYRVEPEFKKDKFIDYLKKVVIEL